jgi:hypothetical protein
MEGKVRQIIVELAIQLGDVPAAVPVIAKSKTTESKSSEPKPVKSKTTAKSASDWKPSAGAKAGVAAATAVATMPMPADANGTGRAQRYAGHQGCERKQSE